MSTRTKVRKAVIPAAGLGTRMLPATKAVPKEMLPVDGKPLIQFAVEEAAAAGIEAVIIVTRSDRSILESHFASDARLEEHLERCGQTAARDLIRQIGRLAEIVYVEQERPQGLAHAISCAQSLVKDEAFAVLLPDVIMRSEIPVTAQLLRAYEEHRGSIIAIREVELDAIERHGIVYPDENGPLSSNHIVQVGALVEKPAPHQATSRLGIFGRYILDPSIWNFVDESTSDLRGELQLTNALHLCCRQAPVYGYFFEGSCYDAGNPLGYLLANVEIALENPALRPSLLRYLSEFSKNESSNEVSATVDFRELLSQPHS